MVVMFIWFNYVKFWIVNSYRRGERHIPDSLEEYVCRR